MKLLIGISWEDCMPKRLDNILFRLLISDDGGNNSFSEVYDGEFEEFASSELLAAAKAVSSRTVLGKLLLWNRFLEVNFADWVVRESMAFLVWCMSGKRLMGLFYFYCFEMENFKRAFEIWNASLWIEYKLSRSLNFGYFKSSAQKDNQEK